MELDRIKSLVVEINEQYQSLGSLSNDELRVRYSQLRNEALDKLQHGISEKEILDSALIEVFSLLKEVTRRFSENDEIKVEQTDLDVKLFENVPPHSHFIVSLLEWRHHTVFLWIVLHIIDEHILQISFAVSVDRKSVV